VETVWPYCRIICQAQPGKDALLPDRADKKGYVKTTRFKNSRNKAAYAYVLTPLGIDEKLHLPMHFLRRKENEYQLLEQEIA
jgi:hypothetical protein